MTVNRLRGCRGRRAPGQVDEQGGWPCPVQAGSLAAPPRRPQRPCPLLDVAGGGGRGLAAHAGGSRTWGEPEVQVLGRQGSHLTGSHPSAAGCSNLGLICCRQREEVRLGAIRRHQPSTSSPVPSLALQKSQALHLL